MDRRTFARMVWHATLPVALGLLASATAAVVTVSLLYALGRLPDRDPPTDPPACETTYAPVMVPLGCRVVVECES